MLGGSALIIWLYRREGRASAFYKYLLAGIRICLVLLLVFMLSEAVLSVERTGLPYLTIMVDDSASEQIADQYEQPETRAALQTLASQAAAPAASTAAGRAGDSPATDVTRIEIAKGLVLKDKARLIQELQKQHKVRLYLVSNSARLLAEVDRPEEIAAGRREAPRGRGDGQPDAPRGRHPAGPDRAPRRASLGDRAPHRRPDHRGRTAGQGRRARRRGRACPSTRSAWATPSRHATWS